MPEVTAGGAMVAARGTFDKTIDVVVKIFVPVGSAVAGFFMPTVLGGGQSVSWMVTKIPGEGTAYTMSLRIAWGVQALINAAVGGAFWTLRKMDGIVAKAIGGAVGGFFLGGALGCVPGVISGANITPGLIDKIAQGLQTAAKEG
jgi:hypothetical protein